MIASLAPSVLAAATAIAALATVPPTQHGESPRPQSEASPSDATRTGTTAKIKPIDGMAKSTVAVYPLIDDPVAFCIDEQGHFYFAESDRQERGVEDNRSSPFWLLDDIQSQSTADRLKMYEKWAAKRTGGMLSQC